MFRASMIIVATLSISLGSPSIGCELNVTGPFSPRVDTRIEVKSDCSFENIDSVKTYGGWTEIYRSGNPVRDRGNGRIAQVLSGAGMCASHEVLLFVDCNAGESLMFDGIRAPEGTIEVAGQSQTWVEYIQRPHGPISIGPASTVQGLAEIARQNGIDTRAPSKYLAKTKKIDRYDLTCGCKLYYPDSKLGRMK